MLTVITGPMFAGKTSALISRGISHVIAEDTVIAFRPSNDIRYEMEYICTHDGSKFAAYTIDKKNVSECYKYIKKYIPNVVLFDEAQFFDKDNLLKVIYDCASSINVIVAGLAQNAYGEPFGAMPELLAFADNIVCLKAVCSRCKKTDSATRTFSKIKLKNTIVVGGAEIYEPRCFDCWSNK